METLLRSIITFVPDPSKCFEIKDGIFKAQHSDKSFFAKISETDDEDVVITDEVKKGMFEAKETIKTENKV